MGWRGEGELEGPQRQIIGWRGERELEGPHGQGLWGGGVRGEPTGWRGAGGAPTGRAAELGPSVSTPFGHAAWNCRIIEE